MGFHLLNTLRRLITEEINNLFHGTRTTLPFPKFDPRSEGTGIVSGGGKRYGGFFFTSSHENAEYYTEWFVATVKIANVLPNPTDSSAPPIVMQQAVKDGKNYLVTDTIDGMYPSDIVVVPMANVNDITILGWEFVGDEEFYFETLDNFFNLNDEEEDYQVTKDDITSTLPMIEVDLNYLLRIPVFKKYYDSKH